MTHTKKEKLKTISSEEFEELLKELRQLEYCGSNSESYRYGVRDAINIVNSLHWRYWD